MRAKIEIPEEKDYIKVIQKLMETLRYGNITLVVQDGKVIQIDKTEKFRL